MAEAVKLIEREHVIGDIVECGVGRGGNIILARKLAPQRICWLYDTFTGMTEPGPMDVRRDGDSAMQTYKHVVINSGMLWDACSTSEVLANLAETGTLNEEFLRIVVGEVERTLLDDQNIPQRIALLRLDTDWYASTKIELEILYPRLSIGGVLIVDDYGHWMGARKAVDDYFAGQNIQLRKIDYTAVMTVKQ